MRKNVKTVTKSYEAEEFNGWALEYQFESENNDIPTAIAVTGRKETTNFHLNKRNGSVSVSFNGGDFDPEVVSHVGNEIALIEKKFK